MVSVYFFFVAWLLFPFTLLQASDKIPLNSSAQNELWLNSDEVLVTAARLPSGPISLYEYPGNVSILTSEDIRSSGASSIPDLLKSIPGIQMTDTSGFGLGGGLGAAVNFRGVGGGDKISTVVLLNGVRLNQPVNNAVIWKAIPLDHIERIEVLKGGSAGTLYGEGALSGVINIITKQADFSTSPKPASFQITETYGSYGENTNAFTFSTGNQKLSLVGHVGFDQWDGYRDDNSYRGIRSSLDLTYQVNESTSWRFYNLYYDEETESPDSITKDEAAIDRKQSGTPGTYWNRYWQTSATLTKYIQEDIRLDLTSHYRERGNDSRIFVPVEIDQEGYGTALNVSWQRFLGLPNLNVNFGIDVQQDNSSSEIIFGVSRPDTAKRLSYGLFFNGITQLSPKLFMETGYRFDRVSYDLDLGDIDPDFLVTTPFDGTIRYTGHSPSIGFKYHLRPNLSLFTSYSRTFKTPAIEDIDSVSTDFSDNTHLSPQTANNYEFGASTQIGGVDIKASVFQINIQDEILFDSLNSQNDNFDTERRGIELELKKQVSPRIFLEAYSTFMSAHFSHGPYADERIPLNPRYQQTARATYAINSFWKIMLEWHLVYNQVVANDFSGSYRVNNYDVFNLQLSYDRNDFRFFIRLNNLFNEKYSTFESLNAFTGLVEESPMPEFGVTVGVSKLF